MARTHPAKVKDWAANAWFTKLRRWALSTKKPRTKWSTPTPIKVNWII